MLEPTARDPLLDEIEKLRAKVEEMQDLQDAEAALRESEARFRSLFQSMAEGAAIHSVVYDDAGDAVDYLVLDVNSAFEQHTGIARDQAIGQLASKLFGSGSPPFLETYARVAETGGSASVEIFFASIGKHFRVLVSSPEKGRFATFYEDVTQRRIAERALKERNAQLESLRQVGLDIASQLDTDGVLRSITERALVLFGADAGELHLYNIRQQVLERVVAIGRADRSKARTAPGEGLAGAVLENGSSLLIDDCAQWSEARGEEAPGWGSAFAVPIRWRDELLGILSVAATQPGAFNDGHREMAELFASQAAVAIINARLYEEVESLAISDELTGLLNRRALLAMGPREFERARRTQRPLSILFVDVDGLKEINDHFSHEVGDRVLQEVTQRMRKSVRAVDILARIGGDEFVVLLVETNIAGAAEVAERLRQAVESIHFETERGAVGVSVSLGLAAAGPGVDGIEALMRKADEAMYAAKQSGRNRLIVLES